MQQSGDPVTKKVNLPRDPARAQRQTELVLEYRRNRSQRTFLDLVKSVDGLIGLMIRRYAWTGIPIEDLRSEATLAVLNAIERHDAERGPFSAIALSCIHTAFRDVARQARPVSMANSRVERNLHHHGSRLYHELVDAGVSYAAAADLVADVMGLDRHHVAAAMTLHGSPYVAVDAQSDDEASYQIADTREDDDEDSLIARQRSALLREALEELPERTRLVVENSMAGHPHVQMSRELGLTRERIRQIHREGLGMILSFLRQRGLILDDLL